MKAKIQHASDYVNTENTEYCVYIYIYIYIFMDICVHHRSKAIYRNIPNTGKLHVSLRK